MEQEEPKNYTVPGSTDSRDLSNFNNASAPPRLPENSLPRATVNLNSKTPKMVAFAIKYSGGLIKSERQASYVLALCSVLAIIISVVVFFNSIRGRSPQKPPAGVLEQMNLPNQPISP